MSARAWKNQWEVESFDPVKASKGTTYTVSEGFDGRWACDCWAWRKAQHKDCKHIDKVKLGYLPRMQPVCGQPQNARVVAPTEVEFDGYIIRRRWLDEELSIAPVALDRTERDIFASAPTVIGQIEAPDRANGFGPAALESAPPPTTEELAAQLVERLRALSEQEGVVSKAAAIKDCIAFAKQLEEVKTAAMHDAEALVKELGMVKCKTEYGVFGWTQPNQNPDPKIDEKALLAAIKADALLRLRMQPYIIQPEPGKPRFYLQ